MLSIQMKMGFGHVFQFISFVIVMSRMRMDVYEQVLFNMVLIVGVIVITSFWIMIGMAEKLARFQYSEIHMTQSKVNELYSVIEV